MRKHMGLFDFFKNKEGHKETTVPSNCPKQKAKQEFARVSFHRYMIRSLLTILFGLILSFPVNAQKENKYFEKMIKKYDITSNCERSRLFPPAHFTKGLARRGFIR